MNTTAPSVINAYVLPADPEKVLIPEDVVVDVTSVSTMIPVSKKSPWYLGKLGWQGRTLPLVAFNRINSSDDARLGQIRYAAVVRTPNASNEMALIAIALSAKGRVAQISRAELAAKPMNSHKASLAIAEYEGGTYFIPDLSYIEQLVAKEQT